ncbi:MAG: mechanosensitive ion channel family protein [Rhodospirillaceae bacterium]
MKTPLRDTLGKLLLPLLISVGIFTFFYVGGDTYQTFGLAAVDSTRKALKYVLGVAAFLSLAILVQRIIRYVIFDGIIASATGAPVPKLLSQISGLVIFLIATSACAGIVFDQDLTVLWAASGVAGLVLGMALKELLQDVFAGIALNIDRAVRIGEFIQLHKSGDTKISGQLLEISWRTARIKDFMGDVVILPNSKFSSCTITNYSQPEPASYRWATVIIDARVPETRAMRILQAAALEAMIKLAGPDTPSPWVEVKAIKLEGVEYAIYFKAEWRFLVDAPPAILQNVLAHLALAGLEPASSRIDLGATGTSGGSTGESGNQLPDPKRLATLIGATRLFQTLAPDDLALLGSLATLRVEMPNRVVAQAGEAGSVLYLVLEGLLSADVTRRSTGRAALPAMLRPGDIFDASVALLGEAHGSTVRSRTPTLLCELDHEALQRLFQASPDALPRIGRALADHYIARANRTDEERAADVLRQIRHLFPSASR